MIVTADVQMVPYCLAHTTTNKSTHSVHAMVEYGKGYTELTTDI